MISSKEMMRASACALVFVPKFAVGWSCPSLFLVVDKNGCEATSVMSQLKQVGFLKSCPLTCTYL
jgi:hypothetical protein